MSSNLPTLVFLHGLLGSGEDWQGVIEYLPSTSIKCVDLPGHGALSHQACHNFDDACELIALQLPDEPYILVGYSLGARLAMYGTINAFWSQSLLRGFVIEGGNIGLHSAREKQQRWENDKLWASRFEKQEIDQVLNDWYQQAVFSHLNHEQRQNMVAKRNGNLGTSIAHMLRATSLAKQPNLQDGLNNLTVKKLYIHGEQDNKFAAIAKQSGLPTAVIKNAGHNAHLEQPEQFARELTLFANLCS